MTVLEEVELIQADGEPAANTGGGMERVRLEEFVSDVLVEE